MIKFRKMKFFIIMLISLVLTSSCSSLPGADARKVSPNAKERAEVNSKEGKGFRLMNRVGKGGTNFEFASSNELWRASLDTIDFMPLTTANYSGGIIVTDWYSDGESLNESLKVTIRFLSNEIRSDAIDLKIFYKKCEKVNNCIISERKGNIVNELKKEILKKATTYKKLADAKK
jgi:hypothetical protein